MQSKNLRPFIFSFLTLLFFAGCGGGGGNDTVLTIVPAGPTIVIKGNVLEYTASRDDVTWSVQGGDANGTIDANGVYTPPATIPLASPRIVVEADSSDGQVATTQVDLRTGTSLSFGSPVPISDVPLPAGTFILQILGVGIPENLSVRLGSVIENAAWTEQNTTAANPLFNQELDFMGFSASVNLAESTTVNTIPLAILTDSQENPGIIAATDAGGHFKLEFLKSDDQGDSFNAPVTLTPGLGASIVQVRATARIDKEDDLHVVFTENDSSVPSSPTDVFYSRSDDGGQTWSNPKQVSDGTSDGNVLLASMAVDPAGDKIYSCWRSDTAAGIDIFFSFSTDGGQNFSTPAPITTSGHANVCGTAVGPLGEVYIVYDENDGVDTHDQILFIKSTDNGQNFGAAVPVNSDPINSSSFPQIAVDSLGRIDIVWSADPDSSSSGDADTLMYSRSTNNGGVFSPNQPIVNAGSNLLILPAGIKHDVSGRFYVPYYVEDAGMNFDLLVLHAE